MIMEVENMSSSATEQEKNPKWLQERRREVRLRRGQLLDNPLERAVTYKVCTERDELEKSYELVCEEYKKVGLQDDDKSGLRFTKYHLLPSTKVFTATFRPTLLDDEPDYNHPGELVGTLTLVPDSPLGLPMEEVCQKHVQRIRDSKGVPAEVVALAVNQDYRKYNIMMYLYRLMFEYAQMKNISDITCSVTKRHIRFYRTMFLFEPMGELKEYAAANGMEVQCHRLNIKKSKSLAKEVYNSRHFDADLFAFFFTGNRGLGRPLGEGNPLSEADLKYLITERSKFIKTLDEGTLNVMRAEYDRIGCKFPF